MQFESDLQAGAAIGSLVWAWRQQGRKEPYPAIKNFSRSYKQLTGIRAFLLYEALSFALFDVDLA